jgi:hypothetical protein
VPLAELAPQSLHPVLRKTIAELLQELTDSKEVRPYDHGDPHRDRRSDDAHRVAGGRAPHGDSL